MLKKAIYFVLIFFFSFKILESQILISPKKDNFEISLFGNYVSSASIQLNPFLNDPIEKFFSQELKGVYGIGISVKKKLFWDNFYLGLSTEYIKITDNTLDQFIYYNDTNYLHVRVTESVWMIPIEFSAIFDIPSFSEDFKIYLGGGLGLYFGDRKRSMIIFETETINRVPKINLQVLCGMEYKLTNNLSAILQVNFRQAQFNVTSRFPTDRFNYQGFDYFFTQELNSKIYIDGIKIGLGLG